MQDQSIATGLVSLSLDQVVDSVRLSFLTALVDQAIDAYSVLL
jgi:hypothetical protein